MDGKGKAIGKSQLAMLLVPNIQTPTQCVLFPLDEATLFVPNQRGRLIRGHTRHITSVVHLTLDGVNGK
jgi:hypothetical protein